MKNIYIGGPSNLYSFPRQVGKLMRSRITINDEKIKLTDLDFGNDTLRNNEYSYEELSELPFDDAVKIFKAIIRKILDMPGLNPDTAQNLSDLLNNAPENDIDADEYNFNTFDEVVRNLPNNSQIKVAESTRKDPEGINIFYRNEKEPDLAELESGSYVAVDAHGARKIAGAIWISSREKKDQQIIHPSYLLNGITNKNHEEPIILDVYACYAGDGVTGDNNTRKEPPNSGGYSKLPNNTAAILNCDDGDILMSFEKYLLNDLQTKRKENPNLNDPFSIFLYKIFQSPNTCKLIYKDNGGNNHIYENEFLPSDTSKEIIADKMKDFIDWCQKNEIGDHQKLNNLSKTLNDRLDEYHLKSFGDMAAALASYRGDIETAKRYEKQGYDFIRVPISQTATEAEKEKAIKISNSLSTADHLINFNQCKNKVGFARNMADDVRKNKMQSYKEAAIYNIEQGIIPDFVSSDGAPLLLLAVTYQDHDTVKLLLEKGADPMKKNKKPTKPAGVKILNTAIFKADVEIIKLLVGHEKIDIEKNGEENSEKALTRMINESNNRKNDTRRDDPDMIIPPNITKDQIREIVAAFNNAHHPLDNIIHQTAKPLSSTELKQNEL